MIRKGDVVTFKPEWRDPGDEAHTFKARENLDAGARDIAVECTTTGLFMNPWNRVELRMIETVNGKPYTC